MGYPIHTKPTQWSYGARCEVPLPPWCPPTTQQCDGASTGTSACWDAKNKKYQARVLNSATGKWEFHGRYGTEQAALAAAAAAAKGKKSPTAETLQCPCCGYDNALELKDDEAKRSGCKQTWKCVNPRCSKELRGAKLGKAGTVARCELCGKFGTIKNAERHAVPMRVLP